MSLPRSKPNTFKRDAFQELSSSLRAVTLFVFFITVSWKSRIVALAKNPLIFAEQMNKDMNEGVPIEKIPLQCRWV